MILIGIGFCIGIVLGYLLAIGSARKKPFGNLVIIEDPEENPCIFLEINRTDIDELRTLKTIELDVIWSDVSPK